MTKKIIYNPSPLYNLLFRGGWIQINPLSHVEVEPKDMHYFDHALRSGQVTQHDSVEEITSLTPTYTSPPVEPPAPAPVAPPAAPAEVVTHTAPVASGGLDEAQLKEFLATKEVKPAGIATKLGGTEDSVFLGDDEKPAVEPEPVVEVVPEPEPVVEPVAETKDDDGDDDGDDKPDAPAVKRGRKPKAK